MELSPFDLRLLAEGLAYFTAPRLAELLDTLGRTEDERVDTLSEMLRNSSEDEITEAVSIFERAVTRVAREQVRAQDEGRAPAGRGEPRRRRGQTSAEWREERRRAR